MSPQWCDKHQMHTIDEDCPGCERDLASREELYDPAYISDIRSELEALRAQHQRLVSAATALCDSLNLRGFDNSHTTLHPSNELHRQLSRVLADHAAGTTEPGQERKR